MTLQPYERVLIDGTRRELLEFGSCGHCIVVDWRDDVKTILNEVKRMLPEGYLNFRQINERTWELKCGGILRTLAVPNASSTEPLLQSINDALLPDYEMRIFTPTIGDGYSLLIRTPEWWREFLEAHAACARKLFVTTEKRATLTGTEPSKQTYSKSWWRRLFGK